MNTLTLNVTDASNEAFKLSDTCFLTLGSAACAYTSAIVKKNDAFLCFDSHSRSAEGCCTNQKGTSVLIEVASVAELISYIRDLAESLFVDKHNTPFEFAPVACFFLQSPSAVCFEQKDDAQKIPTQTGYKTSQSQSSGHNVPGAETSQSQSSSHKLPGAETSHSQSSSHDVPGAETSQTSFFPQTLRSVSLHEKPYHPKAENIPRQVLGNGKRTLKFQRQWFEKYPWLHYCVERKAVLCFECAKSEVLNICDLAKNREAAFSTEGFRNWKKALQRFDEHSRSQSHHFAVQQRFQNKEAEPVNHQLSTNELVIQKEARKCLSVILSSVKYLARQGLALRGHAHSGGNFMELLLWRANDIPGLQEWMKRKTDLTSSDIQNEILLLLSHTVLRKIVERISNTGIFAVIVDETQDTSKKEQLSICIRYVDEDLNPHEDFVGLYEPPSTTGAVIAQCIFDVLVRFQLPLSQLRGQTFDEASNMKGIFKGCQAIVSQKQPLALAVHCGAHCVNLVSQYVSEASVPLHSAIQLVQELGNLFGRQLTAIKQIRPLCPTRWLVKVPVISAVLDQYESVLDCLEEMASPVSSPSVSARASGLLSQLSKGDTVLALKMLHIVLTPLEVLNRSLQSSSETVARMLAAVDQILDELSSLRTPNVVEKLLNDTTEIVTKLNIDPPTVPRQRRPPRRYDDGAMSHVGTTVADHYRPVFFGVLDTAIQQLKERFADNLGLAKYRRLENILISGIIDDDLLSPYTELDIEYLRVQLDMFRHKRPLKTVKEAADILREMVPEVRNEFSEMEKLIRILMVCPASSAAAERSFSALRRLKTWLRSTMGQERLNSIAILHIQQNVLDGIDMNMVAESFVSVSEIRGHMFGKGSWKMFQQPYGG